MTLKMSAVGERTKVVRKKKNISQEELAEMIGISPVHLSRIENGHVMPKIDILVELCTKLEISSDFLLLGRHNSENVLLNLLFNRMHVCKDKQLKLLVEIMELLIVYFEKGEDNL